MTRWLKCKVSDGMFSDELTVTVHTTNGDSYAVFVPKESADRTKDLVKVKAVDGHGEIIVLLPDDRRSVVGVRAEDLQPA